MEFSQYILLAIIALGGFLYVSQILAIETTSILIIACLALVPGLLESPDDVFSGFANEATLTIASMFVLSRALGKFKLCPFTSEQIKILELKKWNSTNKL